MARNIGWEGVRPLRRTVSHWSWIAVLAVLTTSLMLASVAPTAWADDYPNKPVRFVLPFPPGGPTDMLGRLIGKKLSEELGQPFIADNRPGAGGNVGMEIASQTPNDGYSIVLTSPTYAISPSLYKKMNYDPEKNFDPISMVAEIPQVLLVRPQLPIKSVAELVQYAKANPGKLKFGSGGMGTTNHLSSEYFKAQEKLDMLHVPYKGSNQAMLAMMSNEVDMVTIGIPSAKAHILSGKVRALAVLSTTTRLAEFPDVPTTKEAGIDNFDFKIWYAILAPAGTPKPIIAKLNKTWVKIAAMNDVKEIMEKAGFVPLSSTPEEFLAFGKAETLRYGKVIKETKLSIK